MTWPFGRNVNIRAVGIILGGKFKTYSTPARHFTFGREGFHAPAPPPRPLAFYFSGRNNVCQESMENSGIFSKHCVNLHAMAQSDQWIVTRYSNIDT
jgi:hypothetical protein